MLIGLHFNPIHHGSIASVSLTQLAPVATALDEMTQNNLHYAVQCHLRWPLSVPIESLHATSYICEQWHHQDLWRGGAKIEIMSWGTHDGLQGWVQQLLDD